ncbi:MAG: neutral/alkaline non-lysosomal ceramidase N-terminal domain-containing protein [Candidatus Omnitrophica bacterium]|nr:neutral/alkaline non-lysosomal ceramidase N-terminal domain-containing protein [Candidatus Omnitrophota bacterium]
MFHPEVVHADEIRAGVAKEVFALPVGVPLAGYGKRHGKPSVGVHDPVGVRALVIEDGSATAALVSCDLLIINDHLFNAVRTRLLKRGLPSDLVLIVAATHTHSGPGAYGTRFFEKISMGHYDPRVFEVLVNAIVDTVIHAYAKTVPVQIGYATVPTQGLVKNRMEDGGLVDAELILSAVYPGSSRVPLAVIATFAAHPTTLGSWNRWMSGDYPGVLMAEVERQIPGTTCLFFAGSVGDQAPTKAGIGYERAAWIGQTLAQRAVAALREVAPVLPQRLNVQQVHVALAPPKVRLGPRMALPRWIGRRFVDDDATLSVLLLGNQAIVGVPCDLEADLGQELKTAARARELQPMVIGFADDYIGYCVSEARYHTAEYEALMAFNGPKTGSMLVEEAITLMDSTHHGRH